MTEIDRLARVQEQQATVLIAVQKDVAAILERLQAQGQIFERFVDREMRALEDRVDRLEEGTASSVELHRLRSELEEHQAFVERSVRRFLAGVVTTGAGLIASLVYWLVTTGGPRWGS